MAAFKTEKMKTVGKILGLLLSCAFFLSFDIMHTLEDDNSIVWWSVHVGLLGFFYFFLQPSKSLIQFFYQPLIGKPSYSNLSKWYVSWLFLALAYRLPSFQSVAISMRMNLSLFLTIFIFSTVCLLVFRFIFILVVNIFSSQNRKWHIWTILQFSAVVSIACCVFRSHCRERPLEQRNLKDKVCSYWLAPVESERYCYPLFCMRDENCGTICVPYFKLPTGSESSRASSSDEISLICSCWFTFIGLYIVNYVAERSSESGEKSEEKMKPDFLDMVPWYSGTSADLCNTFFDLIISRVLKGRFDFRVLQTAVIEEEIQGDCLHHDFSMKGELWFDMIADTGDGGNSTYTVARLLAQLKIKIDSSQKEKYGIELDSLERGHFLLIGGDLAYPTPSMSTYEMRLFRPFEYALQGPPCHEKESITVNNHAGPLCFVIPGNHDWFDGLDTFTKNICNKSWLGGWFMPQKTSYFTLQLPWGWWVFGLDLALHSDIDDNQFKFFSKLAKEKVGKKDSVIIMTHEPDWLVDWYENGDSRNNGSDYQSKGNNVLDLIYNILQKRCKLRIAGDIHHYMHHSIDRSKDSNSSQPKRMNEPDYPQHLLVNGCGGAFAHPTHVFRNFNQYHGVPYKREAAYPSIEKSRRLALRNIWNFRKENRRFDIVGGIIYFTLVYSLFPQCKLDHIFEVDSISGFSRAFFGTVWNAFMYVGDWSYVSLIATSLFLIVAVAFAPSKLSLIKRIMIGILHVFAHLAVALILMLVLEVGIETFVRFNLIATSDYHSLYRWLQSMFHKHLPIPIGIQNRLKQWTFGLYPACIKYLMSAFDVPELMAVTRSNICKNGMQSLPRRVAAIYYAPIFLYFWVLSTPAVALVLGNYLYICINWFNLHYDEAFSSLRIADYKAFTRFHINHMGDLEVYTLAVDKVPKEWEQDPEWMGLNSDELSHLRENPSQWKAAASDEEPLKTVSIIDKFVIRRTGDPGTDSEQVPEQNSLEDKKQKKKKKKKKKSKKQEN